MIDDRSVTKERSNGASPWLGVVHCDSCGDRLYRQVSRASSGRTYEYYRCARKTGKPACHGHSFKAQPIDEAVRTLVTGRLGALPMTVRKFVPGEDHTEQLQHVTHAMQELRSEKRHGLFDYPGGDDEYSEALELLVTERRRLAALPQRPSAWVEVETGETFTDAWNSADQEHRRLMLINIKARLYISPTVIGWNLPKDLEARIRQDEHTHR